MYHPYCQCDEPALYPKRPKRFFFSGLGGRPEAVLAIWRITREIGESSSESGVAVFCVRRAVA